MADLDGGCLDVAFRFDARPGREPSDVIARLAKEGRII
jgi:hypothetical protein